MFYLEVKIQQTMFAYLFIDGKLVAARVFRRFEASREAKLHQQMYGRQFYRRQNSNQGKGNVFRGKSKRNQVSLSSLEVKTKKAKNEWLFLRIQCIN